MEDRMAGSVTEELVRVLRACIRVIWRATLRRGRLPIASGRARSASLQFAAQGVHPFRGGHSLV